MKTQQTLDFMFQLTSKVLTDAVHAIGSFDDDVLGRLHILADADRLYIRQRMKEEGTDFFTKSLPSLGKRFDGALLGRELDVADFKNPATGMPVFDWLFDLALRTYNYHGCSANPMAVKLIRQLTYLFYKYELPYSHETKTKVLESFISTEQELPESGYYAQSEDPVLLLASNLIANAVHRFNGRNIIPKHGPGAVATGEKAWEKMRFARIYKSLEVVYPFTEWMCPNLQWVADNLQQLATLQVHEKSTAKVVLVPKDSRGPRLISCEPLETQWIQQGICKQLVKLLERGELTRGRINFTDQEVNRRLALYGSMGADWVTIDMKDASDRVSLAIVQKLFEKTALLEYLLASRSEATKLPNGDEITMKKFAPMGSAVCFPVEALVFWAIGVASMHLEAKQPLDRALASLKVYGDDIIMDSKSWESVTAAYERYHLVVNRNKCCTTGFFRESCGMDAYRGMDVTPVKIRSVWSSQPDCATIVSYVEVSNLLYQRGFAFAADELEQRIRSLRLRDRRLGVMVRKLPEISDESPKSYVCFRRSYVVSDFKGLPSRYNPVLQRSEIRALVSQPLTVQRKRPGSELMFKSLIDLEHRDGVCKAPPLGFVPSGTNTQSYPLRGRISLKPRWCQK